MSFKVLITTSLTAYNRDSAACSLRTVVVEFDEQEDADAAIDSVNNDQRHRLPYLQTATPLYK